MDQDLERFENRSDDWLAKQKKLESKISAWDFDEGKRIKEEHEEDCEAKEIKEIHAIRHAAYNRSLKVNPNESGVVKKVLIFYLMTSFIIMIGFIVIGAITGLFPEAEILFGLIPLFIVIVMLLFVVRRTRK